ncbi:MAG: DUF1905 domain-containing protein [Proteobacteria bacterium]|nr:MAG: DUF1905 domain-containing protein [Pseudomonadota bacterium]
MDFLVKEKRVKIRYKAGNGAWTYHIVIPGTKKLHGSWGYTKVSGTIDDVVIHGRNLMPVKNGDMMMSVNAEIRKALGKGAGSVVTLNLTLDVDPKL